MNGLQLKEIRSKLGLTQTELALKVGVAMRTVQNWEKETNKIPKSTELFIENLIKSTENSYSENELQEPNSKYGNTKIEDKANSPQRENENDPGVVSRLVKMLDDANQEIKFLRQELQRKKNS